MIEDATKPELKYLCCIKLGLPREVMPAASIKKLKKLGYIKNPTTLTDKGIIVVELLNAHAAEKYPDLGTK